MEDAHTTVLTLDEDSADPNTFFAVYDGHGGPYCSLKDLQWLLIFLRPFEKVPP